MSKLFQIYEEDLTELEHTLSQFQDDLIEQLAKPAVAPRLRKQLRRVQEILMNVRWNYGPPTEVEIIPVDGE